MVLGLGVLEESGMSFVIAMPEFVTAAAGDLANIGSALGEANAAAALPTTSVLAAAEDEVSTGIAQMFGTYAQQFQSLSAQAASFHNEFVSLLNGGAAAYLGTEAANAGQTLQNAVNAPAITGANFAANAAADTPPLLGGLGGLLGGGGGTSSVPLLGGLLGGGAADPITGALGGLLSGVTNPSTPLLGGLNSLLAGGSGGLLSPLTTLNSALLSGYNTFAPLGTAFLSGLPTLTDLTGPLNVNLGNLTPGLSLTTGLFAPLAPTLNGVGLDLGNFLSNELVNGVTLNNLTGAVTGLFQDVPALQGLQPLLQSLLPGLFGQPMGPLSSAAPNPYQVLGETTVINLNLMGSDFMKHPFPVLNQIYTNQNAYGRMLASGIATDLQNFPANVPDNFQIVMQGASSFNPSAMGQTFLNGSNGYAATVGSSLQHFGSDIQGTFPKFENDMGQAGTAISTGDYHGAVQDGSHGILDLFISGFDTSHLGFTSNLTSIIPPDFAIGIAGPIGLLGPAGDLLPILTATGQQAQGLASLAPPTSIPGQMLGHFANAVGALTDSSVTANFAVNAGLPGVTLAGTAMFGLPLQLGFAVLGPPFATLDGVATGATAFSTAMQAGDGLGAANALGNMPAYALNGFLNGQVMVDLPLPVTVTVTEPIIGNINLTLPATAHVPFDGILVPPQPLSVTIPLNALGITIPVNATLGGTEFGGLFPFLFNTMSQQIATAIST
jgi:PE family